MQKHLLSSLILIPFFVCTSSAKDIRIAPQTDVNRVVKNAVAGDTITLVDGNWSDKKLKFNNLIGTAEAPIQIQAETPGKVVFSGKTEFCISGNYVLVSGLVFRDCDDVSDVFQLRSDSKQLAQNCRVTGCVFEETSAFDSKKESHWLSVYGTSNRVDHCYFAGKKSAGTTLVVWVTETPGKHRIDHNHFGPRPELKRNGGETIRIGTSDVSELVCQAVVEENYFYKCDGEAEIISNKSCENTYRHNWFDECAGTLTLRHGHRCLVDGNVFMGKQANRTGGVRIIGQGHRVTNNYFEGLRGDAERAAISLMNGVPNGPLNGYAPVRDALVSNNTLLDCKVSMEFGVGFSRKQSVAPSNCQISHNLFSPGKWSLFRVQAEPLGFVWEDNKQQTGNASEGQLVEIEQVDFRLVRASDGLLRPTDAKLLRSKMPTNLKTDLDGEPRGESAIIGCDEPNTPFHVWPSSANTGPDWQQELTSE